MSAARDTTGTAMARAFHVWVLPGLLLAFAVLVLGGFPAALRFQSLPVPRALNWLESASFLLLGGALVLLACSRFGMLSRAAAALFERFGASVWLPLLLGLLLRLLLALLIHPMPASDGATYLSLAIKLSQGEPYATGPLQAYWPPGLPLALTPLVAVFGPGFAATLIYGLVCFLLAGLGAWRLARLVGLTHWAAVPVWLLALWPSHALCTGLPEKELLVLAIVPWVLVFAGWAFSGRLAWAILAGLACGAGMLIQPSLQLLPPAGLVLGLLLLRQRVRVVLVFGLLMLGMLAAVMPWTYRNYVVLGVPVLVSSNGGSNVYRANNELATGGYIDSGRVDLSGLSEMQIDREGRRLAIEWVRAHPGDFLELSASKALNFSGDDSYGAFAAFKRGVRDTPVRLYQAVKLLAAAPWLLLWLTLAVLAWQHWRNKLPLPAGAALLMLPYAYLFGIHSIFESGGKYHWPTLVPLLVLVVLLARRVADAETSSEVGRPQGRAAR